MSAAVFERHEVKFLLTREQRDAFLARIGGRLVPDEYGESTICNVYYDTPDFRLIRRSLERPEYKEKLRLRSYGPAKDGTRVFLELKKKYAGIVYKRRITLQCSDAEDYMKNRAPLADASQIGREIKYFKQFYGVLIPACYLCYDRTAFFAKEDPSLRITFDKNIRFSTENVTLTSRPHGEQLLENGQSLMEIKIGDSMPLWLTCVLTELGIRKTSFSKYGSAYERMLCEEFSPERSLKYA